MKRIWLKMKDVQPDVPIVLQKDVWAHLKDGTFIAGYSTVWHESEHKAVLGIITTDRTYRADEIEDWIYSPIKLAKSR